MLLPLQKCYALKYKQEIFVVGAKNRNVQIFNIYNKKWKFAPKLNYIYNKGCKLCTFNYKLIAMNKTNISKYEIYDEYSNRWYATDIRNHPINALYPKPFNFNKSNNINDDIIYDWWHLGRRYW